jgi:TonB-linked SusC/RagA family outer membrane protein
MKKFYKKTGMPMPFAKIDLKLKLATLFLFATCFNMLASSKGDTQTITLEEENTPIIQVVDKIEATTNYRFVYNTKFVDLQRKVSIKLEDASIEQVLAALFYNTNTSYQIIRETQIILKAKGEEDRIIPTASKPSQEIVVNGIVLDETGAPLPGANVQVKGTNLGTITDFDGNFSLEIPSSESVIVISYIGYATQEVSYDGQKSLSITLEPSAASLDEVVVIGYGSVAKKELTGSVAQAENIDNRAVTKVEEALQGNVPGVTIVSDGGDPTSTPTIKIRGVGTTSPEAPLWVVDGVPYFGGPLNPFDIKSITVLKDAASASIYGVRAAGGVILVETKQGKAGKVAVSFGIFTGVQNVGDKPTALNAQQYTDAYNLAYANSGIPALDYFDSAKNPDRLINRTNWVDEIFRTGIIQNYDVGLRGGSENFKFSSSIGYNTKEGILLNTHADRLSFRFNSTAKLNDQIKIGQNFSYTYTNGQSVFTGTQGDNGETNYNGIIAAAIKAPPYVSVYNADGSYSDIADGQNGDVLHPVGTLNRIDIDNPERSLFGNLFLEYKPVTNLTFKTNFAITRTDTKYEEFQPRVPEQSKVQSSINRLITQDSERSNWTWENTLDYKPELNDDNSLQLLAGYSLQKEEGEINFLRARGFENEDRRRIVIPLADEIEFTDHFYSTQTLVSFFSRAVYDYKKKYFISASIRRDGSSKLTDDLAWENFPSVAVGWQLSEEDFFNSAFVNNLKFRASWGKVGNIESTGSFPTDVPLTRSNVILGNPGYSTAVSLDSQSNETLTWETSETTNFGVDLSSTDNKITFTTDYFIRTTKDLLLKVPLNSTRGVLPEDAPFQNAGEVQNKGLEIALGVNKNEGDFTYNLTGNVSFIQNEMTSIKGSSNELRESETQVATHFPLWNSVGQPLFSFRVLETDGLLRTDAQVLEARANGQPNAQLGDIKFVDQNGDLVINDDDRVYKGSSFPKTTFGFNGNFTYKNFDFSIFIQGASGAYAYNGYKFTTTYPAHTSIAGANLSDFALDTWSPSNPNASNPRLSIDDPNQNIRMSDFWLESTDYVRIKNLSVGYSLKANRIYDALRIYATAQNLYTWTNYSGLDPEVGNRGIDGGQYPVSRVFTLGLNVTLK